MGCLHGPLQDVASFEYGPRVVQQSFSCVIQTLMANWQTKVSLLGTSCDNVGAHFELNCDAIWCCFPQDRVPDTTP